MAGRRRRGSGQLGMNAEINVVSLIDVMMLMMIIFMITAPMMQGGVDVSLPQADARPLEQKSGLIVSVDRSGNIFVDRDLFTMEEFRASFGALSSQKGSDGVYLRADQDVNYGVVVQVLAIMRAAGSNDVGLVTEPETITR